MPRIVPLPSDFSDGSKDNWPTDGPERHTPSDMYYHEKLLESCAEQFGLGKVAKGDRFEKLPKGYTIFIKTRSTGTHHDRYLYGHPNGKFDSPVKFKVHFVWLMGNRQSPCDCVKCSARTATPRAPRAPKMATSSRMYRESTPDEMPVDAAMIAFVQKYIDRLYDTDKGFDVPFLMGPANHSSDKTPHTESVPTTLIEHPFIPRVGELVLFHDTPDCEGGVWWQKDTQCIGYVKIPRVGMDTPKWKAGRIIEAPEPGLLTEHDLKWWEEDTKGEARLFTVEEVPHSEDQLGFPLKKHKLHLVFIRPYFMLPYMLNGVPQYEWAKNIKQVTGMMNAIALIDPYRVVAKKLPNADDTGTTLSIDFLCHHLWLGTEMIVPGDVVTRMPKDNTIQIHRALIVQNVGYHFSELEKKVPVATYFLSGRHITTVRPNKAAKPIVTEDDDDDDLLKKKLPKCLKGITWYDVTDPKTTVKWGPGNIVSRFYGFGALNRLCFAGDIDIGARAIRTGRDRAERENGYVPWIRVDPFDNKGVVFEVDGQLRVGAEHRDRLRKQKFGNAGGGTKQHAWDTATEKSEGINKMSVVNDSEEDDVSNGDDDLFHLAVASSKRASSNSEDDSMGGSAPSGKKPRLK